MIGLIAAIGANLSAVAPRAAFADGSPIVVRGLIDVTMSRPLLTDACGHQVFLHIVGTTRAVVRFDGEGNAIREEATGLATFTFFAPERGTSVSHRMTVSLFTEYFADGTAIGTVTGLPADVQLAGGAPPWWDTGRTVYSAVVIGVSGDDVPIVEPVEVLSDTGTSRGSLQAICAALRS